MSPDPTRPWDPEAPLTQPTGIPSWWRRFRSWRLWQQLLVAFVAVVVAWPVLVGFIVWRSSHRRGVAIAVAVVLSAVYYGALALSSDNSNQSERRQVEAPSPTAENTTTIAELDDTETLPPGTLPPTTLVPATAALEGQSSDAGGAGGCRTGDPLANVYHPYRLEVVRVCATVSGIVETVRHEPDGDYHFDLALDPPYAALVNSGNATYQHGYLVAEIVPADEPGCTPGQPPRPPSGTYDYGRCTGASTPVPSVGAHVSVTGPYVIDHEHGWAEIHPVWRVAAPAPGATSSPAPPTTASASGTPPAAGRGCDPSYPDFCIPPPPPDLDCKDVAPHHNFTVLPPDPHHFDADHDGKGCES